MGRGIPGLMLFLLISHSGHAESATDSWENVKRVRTGRKIEVIDMRLRSVQGKFVACSDDAIVLDGDRDRITVPRANVFSVKDRQGPGRGRRALLGLAIGAGAGAAIGAVRGATYHEEGETGVFMLAWTPIGAGIGAAAGATIPVGEKTIYRAKGRGRP